MSGDMITAALFRFTGRIISLFVHEINNHLATLRESSGLGDDLMHTRTLSDKEKLKEIETLIHTIENRIGNASSLVRVFGNFGSHLADPDDSLDINLAIEGLHPFFSKIARQNNLSIQSAYGRNLPAVRGSFSFLQCLLFAIFENLCASLVPQTAVRISTEKTASSIIVSLAPDRAPAALCGKEPWPEKIIEAIAAAAAANIDQSRQGGAVSVRIDISA
jgi:C4-dicarboxylate-specific signal transduction histidine kinase